MEQRKALILILSRKASNICRISYREDLEYFERVATLLQQGESAVDDHPEVDDDEEDLDEDDNQGHVSSLVVRVLRKSVIKIQVGRRRVRRCIRPVSPSKIP
jgi:hypothetical protein